MEEKEMTTKEKILNTSLKLFSEKGYDGVSMREIATAVGIKGASIYSHFKGKQDIFEAIFKEMKHRYDIIAMNMQLSKLPEENAAMFFKEASDQLLLGMTEDLFAFYAKDEFIMMFRKLLFSEQHKNEMASLYLREYYLEAPVNYQSELFENMQKLGKFVGFDAKTMALHFYSPIYYTLCAYDLGRSYEDCLDKLKKHVHYFCKCYS